LLRHLALETVVLVMDGSGVGRGCTALMIHVVYKGRALPLAWRVRHAPKGHFPEDLHIQWSRQKSGGDSAISSEFVIAGMIFHPSRVKSQLLHK
jgi:hypothetical protein